MRSWWKQRRAWAIALVPALAAALALSIWHAGARMSAIEDRAAARAHALARQFAALVEPDFQAGDRARLQQAAEALRGQQPTVVAVAVTAGARTLAEAGAIAQDVPADTRLEIERPIGSTHPEGGTDAPAGALRVIVDLSPVHAGQSAVLLESIALAAMGSLVALGAAIAVAALAARRRAGRSLSHLYAPVRGNEAVASRELQAAMAQLEHDNARLEEARREAEAASARKSRYLADVSHEIRTPMNAILGFTELLARDDQRLRHGDYIATVRDSIRGLLGLLNGILDLSKVEAGQMELRYEEVDLNELLAEMFRLFAPQTFAKGVELVVVPLPLARARMRADPLRLKQVLVNLVSNAIRYTERGHVRLAAHTIARKGRRRAVRFTVDDTGPGIPEEVRPRLFEAFAQGRGAGEGDRAPALEPGTGLGLAIASELVSLMGGHIDLRSTVGKGSSFWFTLELDRPRRAAAVPAPTPRRRVALIDSQPVTREAHMALLACAGIDADPRTAAEWGAAGGSPGDAYEAIVVHVPATASAHGPIPPADARLAGAGVLVLALVYENSVRLRHALHQAGYAGVLGKTADPAALRRDVDRALDGGAPEPADEIPEAATPVGRRLLVVDDCTVNREVMRQYARSGGFEVSAAADSDEALRLADSACFDAIVIDVRLPKRDGIDTAQRLRTGGGPNATTPIVAVTGDALAAQAPRALRAGIDDVLVKPVTREALLECLAACLNTTAPSRDDGAQAEAVSEAETQEHVIDRNRAMRRAAGKPDLARELFAALCRSLPASREALARARAERDAAMTRAEAHRLRGAVLYCGVPRLEAAVGRLDRAAHGGDAAALDEAFTAIDQAIAEVLKEADDGALAAGEAQDAGRDQGTCTT